MGAETGVVDPPTSATSHTGTSPWRRYVLHPLAFVLALGVILRVIAMIGFQPAWAGEGDSQQYIRTALDGTFQDPLTLRPAGYPLFVSFLHEIRASQTLVVLVQHLLGLASACLVYLTVRRVDAPRLLAAAAAAVIAINPDYIFFEQALMSESLFVFLASAALYIAVLGLADQKAQARTRRWVGMLAAAGAVMALAAMVRSVGQVVIPVAALALAVGIAGWRQRAIAVGAFVVPAAVLILGYSIAVSAAGGEFGLSQGSGWALYTRIAPVADCTRFDVPEGTEGLCETTSSDTRPGPDYYAWNPESQARAYFTGPPHNDEIVGRFGRRAILAQPIDWAKLVATDMWRYVNADAGPDRFESGLTLADYKFGLPVAPPHPTDPTILYYGPYEYETNGLATLMGDIQTVVRVHGVLVLASFLFAIAGSVLARGMTRTLILLLGGTAIILILFPAMISTYNGRYALAAYPGLVSAGLLGAWVVAERAKVWLRNRTSAAEPRRDLAGQPAP